MMYHLTNSLSLKYKIKIKSPELLLYWGLKKYTQVRKFAKILTVDCFISYHSCEYGEGIIMIFLIKSNLKK